MKTFLVCLTVLFCAIVFNSVWKVTHRTDVYAAAAPACSLPMSPRGQILCGSKRCFDGGKIA